MTSYTPSALWCLVPSDLNGRLEQCIDKACRTDSPRKPGYLFFRADDVGVPGKRFARLMDLFAQFRVPLCLAVVPAWLTGPRWQRLKQLGQGAPSLWCWHQHGWRHLNHEAEGKKQEFGQARPPSRAREDLIRGRRRLEKLMGDDFYPVFTPPWNRCDGNTLTLLKDLGFRAVSRSHGSLPPAPMGLPDLAVSVDLHTRKEVDPAEGWHHLFEELGQGISRGLCGIMIHHQRMNDAAFFFLELLFQTLVDCEHLRLMHFKDLTALSSDGRLP